MLEITTMRIWIGVSLVWPLFWMLVFDRWFLLSPLGFLFTFGLPTAAWVLWWKFFRGEEEKILSDARNVADRNVANLLKLKKRLVKQR